MTIQYLEKFRNHLSKENMAEKIQQNTTLWSVSTYTIALNLKRLSQSYCRKRKKNYGKRMIIFNLVSIISAGLRMLIFVSIFLIKYLGKIIFEMKLFGVIHQHLIQNRNYHTSTIRYFVMLKNAPITSGVMWLTISFRQYKGLMKNYLQKTWKQKNRRPHHCLLIRQRCDWRSLAP